jgi:hypothetical protein
MTPAHNGRYILDARGEPVPCEDLFAWGEWLETNDRTVDSTLVEEDTPRLRVSTVFLGLDYDHSGKGPPVLWETMIFASEEAPAFESIDYQERYTSRAAAVKGHRRAVSVAKRMLQELDASREGTGTRVDSSRSLPDEDR